MYILNKSNTNDKTNNMLDLGQKLEDRLCISSVIWFIPYFGFFDGVDRLMDERTRDDIHQLLIQVKYNININIQVLWRLVDYIEDSNVNSAPIALTPRGIYQCRS